ncbi:MAG: flagellar protein FlaG [Candidatus Competibacteraceae bacterium]|nr:flagellar protein FlaG [Candidatus Competibacteraceae bacterium]
MGDIGSLNPLAGVNPTLDRATHAARSAPIDPPTVQNATAQPLNSPQAAVTQPPTASHPEWQREANPDDQRQNPKQRPPDTVLTRQQLSDLLDHLNQRLIRHNIHLQFEVDDTEENLGVRIVDQETQAVVRRMTLEDALAFVRSFDDLESQQDQEALGDNRTNHPQSGRLRVEGGLLRVTA